MFRITQGIKHQSWIALLFYYFLFKYVLLVSGCLYGCHAGQITEAYNSPVYTTSCHITNILSDPTNPGLDAPASGYPNLHVCLVFIPDLPNMQVCIFSFEKIRRLLYLSSMSFIIFSLCFKPNWYIFYRFWNISLCFQRPLRFILQITKNAFSPLKRLRLIICFISVRLNYIHFWSFFNDFFVLTKLVIVKKEH